MKSWVVKQGYSRKNWKKRWMVEEPDKLSYYTKDNEKVKRGKILKDTILQVAPIQWKNKSNVLCVFTQNRNFLLCLADANLANRWLNAIREAIKCDTPVVVVTTSTKPKPGRRLFGWKKRQAQPVVDNRAQTIQPQPQPTQTNIRQVHTIQPVLRAEANSANNQLELKSDSPHEQTQESPTQSSPQQANSQPQRVRRAVLTRSFTLGQTLASSFRKLKDISNSAAYGKTQQGIESEDNLLVMKTYQKSDTSSKLCGAYVRFARSVLSTIKHPYVMELHSAFETQSFLYILTPFVPSVRLFDILNDSLTLGHAQFWMSQIVLGLEEIHRHGIVFRDFQPKNVLLTEKGNVVLTGFGFSKFGLYSSNDRYQKYFGTPEYMAPEAFYAKSTKELSSAVDWWSFGVVLYEMVFGGSPFATRHPVNDLTDIRERLDNLKAVYHKIVTHISFLPDNLLEPTVEDLFKRLLALHPSVRPNSVKRADEPQERLADADSIKKHPFFQEVNWKKLQEGTDDGSDVTSPFLPPNNKLITIDHLYQELNDIVEKDLDFGDDDFGDGVESQTEDDFGNLTFTDRTYGHTFTAVSENPTANKFGDGDQTFGDTTFSDRSFGGRTFGNKSFGERNRRKCEFDEAENEIVLHEYVPIELLQREIGGPAAATIHFPNLATKSGNTTFGDTFSGATFSDKTLSNPTHPTPAAPPPVPPLSLSDPTPAHIEQPTRQRARTAARGQIQLKFQQEEREWEGNLASVVETVSGRGRGRIKTVAPGDDDGGRFSRRGRNRNGVGRGMTLDDLFSPRSAEETEKFLEEIEKAENYKSPTPSNNTNDKKDEESDSYTTSDSESSTDSEEFIGERQTYL